MALEVSIVELLPELVLAFGRLSAWLRWVICEFRIFLRLELRYDANHCSSACRAKDAVERLTGDKVTAKH